MTLDVLLDKIADNWGGVGCPRGHVGQAYRFIANDGMTYIIYMPDSEAELAEDNGRPFMHKVTSGVVLVRCITDAPDAWFHVRLDGWYSDPRGVGKQL